MIIFNFRGSFLMPKVRQLGVLTPFSLFRAKCPNTLFALRGTFLGENFINFYQNIFKKVKISKLKI